MSALMQRVMGVHQAFEEVTIFVPQQAPGTRVTINSGGFVDLFHKVWKICGTFSTTFPQTGKIMDTEAIEAAPDTHPLFYRC